MHRRRFPQAGAAGAAALAFGLAGPAFSPDGTRLYLRSQRAATGGGPGPGITYEVRPFRTTRPVAQAARDASEPQPAE